MGGRKASTRTLSCIGAERVVPHYNVMGVAKVSRSKPRLPRPRRSTSALPISDVNAISAGPIETIAAMGIWSSGVLDIVLRSKAPLRRNIDTNDVGDAALFFLSRPLGGQ
jgi:enoyl-[acyl-carrier protein] reductase I